MCRTLFGGTKVYQFEAPFAYPITGFEYPLGCNSLPPVFICFCPPEGNSCRLLCLIVFFLCSALVARPNPISEDMPDAHNLASLKNLSLEELSQIEVTTPSKELAPAFQSPAAIYVITGANFD